jgi:site-specific DNA-methyltransferase (adenine-specific)
MAMLAGVWAECWRVMKPGGRIAVNVAGTGRSPYYPLHHYIRAQLEAQGFGMRGEVIWYKGPVMGTAWGSWKSPSNPALRDVHEYILIFSKGDWRLGHSGEADITAEEFVEYTRSVWEFRPAVPDKVDHPAPFPPELPKRLIKLYTFKDDLVLDPFMGSGTTCQVSQALGRRWIGVDMDGGYCDLARGALTGA